ncbi:MULTISPECIES: hypothetical protein [unclassified Paraburkholderia]|uniref:hypothetical protein n=1 Tax=unclassified Paraburkholderia TaxID=2615204 RepID=UPI0034CECC8D
MKIPLGVRNEALWRKHCRKIRARALDLLEGRFGVIETARVMLPLAYWTKVQNEPEFLLFRAIASETDDLPVGNVRAYWAADALEREDVCIEAAEKLWREQALSAAEKLVERYQWAVRQKHSSSGADPSRARHNCEQSKIAK